MKRLFAAIAWGTGALLAAVPIAVGLGAIAGTGGAAPPTTAVRAPKLDHVKYRLPNGLEVILHRDQSAPLVAVNVWYHVGARDERPGRGGFAHLFEHVMFQGSSHVGDDAHFKFLHRAGASDVNGTTNYDRTNYYETVPAHQLPLALWLESDRMGFLLPALTQAKLDKQRAVVKNERRQSVDNRPYGRANEQLTKSLFPAPHPYHGAILGSMKDLSAATLNDVKAFFRRYYSPANATLVIAGDFAISRAKALVNRYFGPLNGPPKVKPRQLTAPAHKKEQRLTLRDRVRFPRVLMGWVTPSFYQPGDADLDLLSYILARGKASRLYKKLVYEDRVAVSVRAYQASTGSGSTFVVQATGNGRIPPEALEKRVWALLEAVKQGGVTAAELRRARNRVQTDLFKSLQSVGARADMLNHYNHFTGNPDHLAKDVDRYAAATPQSVQSAAKRWLAGQSRVVIQVLPLARRPKGGKK